jgi:hypothetical protein
MVENNQLERDAAGVPHDNWKVVAVVKPDLDPKRPTAWNQAHAWLAQANQTAMAIIEKDMRRSAAAAARGAN